MVIGGWGGIRTPETLAGLPVFKTGAFNHSATHPRFDFVSFFGFSKCLTWAAATILLPNALSSIRLYRAPDRSVNLFGSISLHPRHDVRV